MTDLLHAAPAPGFDDPLGVLRACHRRIEKQLATLARLRAHLPQHGADAQAVGAATAIMRYFDTAAVHHHEDEEESLFPRLLAARPDLAAVADRLEAEHVTMAQRYAALRERLVAIAAQASTELPADVAEAFAAAYTAHIAFEEGQLFAQADAALDAATLATIGGEMAARRGVQQAPAS
ncbi:MAG: hemerythrin domain-containing protein [Burkholderiales bacterium]